MHRSLPLSFSKCPLAHSFTCQGPPSTPGPALPAHRAPSPSSCIDRQSPRPRLDARDGPTRRSIDRSPSLPRTTMIWHRTQPHPRTLPRRAPFSNGNRPVATRKAAAAADAPPTLPARSPRLYNGRAAASLLLHPLLQRHDWHVAPLSLKSPLVVSFSFFLLGTRPHHDGAPLVHSVPSVVSQSVRSGQNQATVRHVKWSTRIPPSLSSAAVYAPTGQYSTVRVERGLAGYM